MDHSNWWLGFLNFLLPIWLTSFCEWFGRLLLQCKCLSIATSIRTYFYDFRVEFLMAARTLARNNTKYNDVSGSIRAVEQNLIKFQHYILMFKFLIVFFSWQICALQHNSSSWTAGRLVKHKGSNGTCWEVSSPLPGNGSTCRFIPQHKLEQLFLWSLYFLHERVKLSVR